MNAQKPFIVGLAGGSGSGKTTMSRIIAESLLWDVTIVPLDQFYKDLSHLSVEERAKVNFDAPGSLDMDDAFSVLYALSKGNPARIPIYDFAHHNRTEEVMMAEPKQVILFEGMHALYHRPLLELFDLSIFLDIDEETRFQRKVERDIRERDRSYESVLEMWHRYTKPMHNVYVQPTCARADLRFTDTFAPQVIRVVTETITQKVNLKQNAANVFPS